MNDSSNKLLFKSDIILPFFIGFMNGIKKNRSKNREIQIYINGLNEEKIILCNFTSKHKFFVWLLEIN